MTCFQFTLLYESKKSKARVGRIDTPHGQIHTPGFVAVGTNGTLKTLDNTILPQLNQELIFCNTYHLLLQPGPDIIQAAGGLHQFIHHNGPIITDSGGFQVFSLAYGGVAQEIKSAGRKHTQGSVLKISEQGVLFRSYRDGQKFWLTPESSVEAQKKMGADMIIPLDELPPYHFGETKLVEALHRTHRWERRSLAVHLANPNNQAMYGVIHGGLNPSLRAESARYISSLDFEGFAIGGSLGTNSLDVTKVVRLCLPYLEKTRPRHLLGIGDFETILKTIGEGIDTWDSAYPTKIARHGFLLSLTGQPVKILQKKWAAVFEPIDSECHCLTCVNYTKAYLHHLFKAKEPTGLTLASIHNIVTMNRMMSYLREAILEDRL